MNKEELIRQFRDVPAEYRPIPFWSWNDRLDPEELRHQIRMMKEAGIGGFIMHARGGLETGYLGEEWMTSVRACLEESADQGMCPWLYDENGWPSGYANGRVPARDSDYYGRWLVLDPPGTSPGVNGPDSPDILATFIISDTGEYRRVSGDWSPADESRMRSVRVKQTPYYVDVMHPGATDAFLEETHDLYRQNFPEAFIDNGDSGTNLARVAGFFTDEPRFSGSIDRDPPWSLTLPSAFTERFGYDILDHLPALFLPLQGHEGIRFDYYSLCSELFVSSYTDRIQQWCRRNGVKLTGHLMMEESLFVQAANTSGVMPHYAHMDIPGVDWLRRPIGSPVVPKQVGSAAAQLGKKQVLTESFALAGWDVNFEELKRIAEWQYVNGVNLLCQHLQGYSLRGFRKRDYPPSLFYQQPWWSEYRIFNDYISRLGMILAEGEHNARILVIHPMAGAWTIYDGTEYSDELRRLDARFVELCETLSGEHLEYHLGDESIIADQSSVDVEDGIRFIVGECSYDIVIVPQTPCLSSSTLDRLEEFIDAGGLACTVADAPDLLDGRPSGRPADVLSRGRSVKTPKKMCREIRSSDSGSRFISMTPESGGEEVASIHCTERRFDDLAIWFLVNLSQDQGYQVKVSIPETGSLHLYDAADGTAENLPFRTDDEGMSCSLHFEPMQSHLLVLDPSAASEPTAGPLDNDPQSVDLSGRWDIVEMEPNALTLDSCAYRIDDGPIQEDIPVIHLMRQLLELRRPCDIELIFTFENTIESSTDHDLRLAVEALEEFEVSINGAPLDVGQTDWWRDKSFRTVGIGRHVINGSNTISLKRRFHQREKVYQVLFGEGVYETEKNALTYDVELESIYIVGDFFVRSDGDFSAGERNSIHTDGRFSLVPMSTSLEAGDLVVQGLPFYSGKIALNRQLNERPIPGRPYIVSFEKTRAVLAAIDINGERIATIPWASRRIDICPFLTSGSETITITLWSGNRNLLGPHHHVSGETHSVGPESFSGEWSWAEKTTEAKPATPEERTRSYWKDGYAFVTFGIEADQE